MQVQGNVASGRVGGNVPQRQSPSSCRRSAQVAVSEAGELREELKTLKAEYQACQSRYEDERARLENDVGTLGGKLAALEKMCQTESVEKAKLEKELRKVGGVCFRFINDAKEYYR